MQEQAQQKIEINDLLLECITILRRSEDHEVAFNRLLDLVASFYDADRAYIFEFDLGSQRLGTGRFFRRRRAECFARRCEFVPVTCPNIDEFLFLPVTLGFWKQHELWDGTYTLDVITCPWNGKISILNSGGLTITYRD